MTRSVLSSVMAQKVKRYARLRLNARVSKCREIEMKKTKENTQSQKYGVEFNDADAWYLPIG